VLAFALAVAGVAFTLQGPSAAAPQVGHTLAGAALALGGGFAIGVYLIAIRSISQRYTTVVIVGRTYLWAALVLLVTAFVRHESPPGEDGVAWAGIVSMALVSQLVGHTGINRSLRVFPSTTVAMSTLLEPVVAATLAAGLLHEGVSWTVVSGSLLVLAALILILRPAPAT
jgi:drug/metabolite transporter (DMT)-like permease